jgi:asparagine synthase (glutamine-hydrolysing)
MGNITISRNGQSRLPQLLRSGRICKAIFEASALHKNNTSSSTLRLLIGQGVIPLLPNPVLQAVQKLRRKQFFESGLPSWHEHSAINPVFADLHHIAERVRKREKNLQFRPGSDQRDFFVQIIANISAATSELNHSYRALYGMEKRDPTSDVRLVEFCLALPEEQYHKGGISRRLIRRAMENKLPAEVLENKERGLQSADWFECLFASRERIMQTLTDLNQSTLVSSALDLKRMQHLAQQLHQPHKDARKQMAEYQLVLGNGLMIGSFIRWFERGGKNHAN